MESTCFPRVDEMGLKALLRRFIPSSLLLRRRSWHEWRVGNPELESLDGFWEPGRTFVDVGANLGLYTHAALLRGVRVVAIEPHPLLARHLGRLFPRDVTVLSCALSDRVGRATLYMPSHQGRELNSRSSLEIAVNPGCELRAVEVETLTLDSLDLRDVAILKIDVEGHELEVLRGAEQLLRRERPVLWVEIEERHHPGGSQVVFQLVENHGYEGYFFWRDAWQSTAAFDPALHQRAELVKQADAAKSTDYINNFLFLRQGQSKRLSQGLRKSEPS